MQNITKDAAKNRLTIALVGSHDEERARERTEEGIAAFKSMKPGFDLVIDMTELEAGKTEVMEYLAKSKEVLAQVGVGRVVRVVGGGSSLGAMQVQRAGQTSYEVMMADSVEEAHALLDGN